MKLTPSPMRMRCATIIALAASIVGATGCRSAVVVAPRDPNTQTIVTVEERPATNPSDKGLIVREKR
jgi:predicted component of type VI protein secretion system